MKRFVLSSLMLCGLLFVSCGSNNQGGTTPSEPIGPSGDDPVDPGEDPIEPEEPTTFDVEFDFNEFPFEGTTKEYSNNSIEDKHISVVLENYASSFEDITITKIEVPEKEEGYTGLKVIEFEGVELPDLKTLELASRKNDGFLNLTFDHKITEVTITAQPYYKCYEDHWTTGKSMIVYTADAIDEDLGKLVVNGETWEMPGCTYDENWMITEAPAIESKAFEINGNELSISAFAENRMYVHKIAFTFEE